MFVFWTQKTDNSSDKRYMKPVRIIFAGLLCGFVSTAHADIASVQYVQSIISSMSGGSGGVTVQADWNQSNSAAMDYIKNKPTIPTTAADVGAVPTSRTINGNALTADVTLTGADLVATGYSKPNATGAIAATDTVNEAIGKLEKGLDGKQDKLDATANTGNIKGTNGITVTTPTSGDDAGKVVVTGPSLATVATTGAYSDLTGTPTIPTVNDNTLTIQKNGTTIDTFTANAAADKTINITMTASDVGLGNVQNVDQTNASNLTSGTVNISRLPVGTTSTTVAAGNDARFNTVSTTQPSGTPPSGYVYMWFD